MATTRNLKLRKLNENDYISLLPDDILLCILSKLKVKEQARTSVLSSRWAYLWPFNTSGFDIAAFDLFTVSEYLQHKRYTQEKTLKFINTTDKILSMHRGQTLDELKITYPISACETPGDHLKVDGWIDFVKQKQVKALYLDFKLLRKNPVQLLSIGSTTFSSLVTLRLRCACLSADTIHNMLSNSPNLLELSINRTYGNLQHLKISGSFLKLKHLELIDNDVDSVEIFAPDLISFGFRGYRKRLPQRMISFKNTRLLTKLSLFHWVRALDTWSDFCVLFSQLDTLTLTLVDWTNVNAVIPRIPALKDLKEMHVMLLLNREAELCFFLGLFIASPSLCRLSLVLGYSEFPPLKHEFTEQRTDHKFVTEVEISNFSGSDNEVQLVTYIAQSCSSLKKMIIYPRLFKLDSNHKVAYTSKESVESVVKKLASRLPQKELDVLFVLNNSPNIMRFFFG